MPASSDGPDGRKDKWSVAIAHAELRWTAEVDNATRLGERSRALVTLISALLGLGLFKIGGVSRIEPEAVFVLCRLLFGFGILLMTAALVKTLGFKRRSNQGLELASRSLAWPSEKAFSPLSLSCEEASEVAYERTTLAALGLQARNAKEQDRIDQGQILLVIAAAVSGFGILLYIWFAEIPARVAGSG